MSKNQILQINTMCVRTFENSLINVKRTKFIVANVIDRNRLDHLNL